MARSTLTQVGDRFGRLVVIAEASKRCENRRWLCRCDCGVEKIVHQSSLRHGRSKSCGCLIGETTTARCTKHGYAFRDAPTGEYEAWSGINKRCHNPNEKQFQDYGGRGIAVCERWRSFENFLADMGERPSAKHSIDRYPDNNGNYEPSNCRWATRTEQNRNTRANRMLTWQGRTQCVTAWAEEIGLKRDTLFSRLRLGWSVEKALTTPLAADGDEAVPVPVGTVRKQEL